MIETPVHTQRYYDVAISKSPLRQTFTYKAPGRVMPGSRVVVPFSGRMAHGYVLAEGSEPTDLSSHIIKPIEEIVDYQPILKGFHLDLARRTSAYYLTPIGMVMDLFFAGSPKIRVKQRVVLTDPNKPLEGFRAGEVSVDLGAYLGRLSKTKAKRVLQEGIEAGLAEVVFALAPSKQKGRMIRTVCLNGDVDTLLAKNLSPQAWEIIQYLLMHETAPMEMLRQHLGLKSASPIQTLQKKGLIKIFEEEEAAPEEYEETRGRVELTHPQKEALRSIQKAIKNGRRKHLVYGITGSGKTELYFALIEEILREGKQALYLLPEISLTPQMIARIRSRFDDHEVGVAHSMIPARQRSQTWERAVQGDIDILVGTRSALWAPLPNPGLIVLDEEHDESYMQQDSAPIYDAHQVSQWMSDLMEIPVLFGSATPRLESFYLAKEDRSFQLNVLSGRPQGMSLPKVSIVDLIHSDKVNWLFSKEMVQRMDQTLARKKQAFVLVQRKGFAPFVSCTECGYVHRCTHCDVSMTYHKPRSVVKCHYCGLEEPYPRTCPQCQSRKMVFRGFGTEKAEAYLADAFPEARILRIDRELIKDGPDLRDALALIRQNRVDIVVGTKMISKGLDFPNVELVVILDADQSLHFPDFRSVERTFQLISQMAGRAGRDDFSSPMAHVVVQTLSPSHPSIQFSAVHDYPGFYEHQILLRKEALYPPFCHVLSLQWEGYDPSQTLSLATSCTQKLKSDSEGTTDIILGPVPALIFKMAGMYRYHTMVKTTDVEPSLKRLERVCGPDNRLVKPIRIVVDPVRAMA